MTFCRLLGAEPYIAVNTGLGNAHSAAEEVEYVNGPATSRLGQWRAANGHPAPYGAKIWGIGNEMCGEWQWGHMSITQYPEKHNLVVKAMRQVDPTIKLIASGATPEELSWTYIENRQLGTFPGRAEVRDRVPFGFGTQYDWTGALLEHSADYIDYLGEHFYGYPNLAIDAARQAFVEADDPIADRVRRMSNKVKMKFEAWEEYLKRMPSRKTKDIKFAFDEWAPRNRSVNPSGGASAPTIANPMLNPMLYDLPVGKNRVWKISNRVADAIIGGWQTGGTLTLQSGMPGNLSIGGIDTASAAAGGYDRPNATGVGPYLSNSSAPRYWNLDAFVEAPPGQFGNVGRNSIIGPGIIGLDAFVHKEFHMPYKGRPCASVPLRSLQRPQSPELGNAQSEYSVGGCTSRIAVDGCPSEFRGHHQCRNHAADPIGSEVFDPRGAAYR